MHAGRLQQREADVGGPLEESTQVLSIRIEGAIAVARQERCGCKLRLVERGHDGLRIAVPGNSNVVMTVLLDQEARQSPQPAIRDSPRSRAPKSNEALENVRGKVIDTARSDLWASSLGEDHTRSPARPQDSRDQVG